MNKEELINEIKRLKSTLSVTVVAHFYQRDEVYYLADITGDSLELAKKASSCNSEYIVFCGVGFMGQSVKILAPQKRVLMPKLSCCSMAKMIDDNTFENSVLAIEKAGVDRKNILPVTYINSNAYVKAKVGMMDGYVCTSANAKTIIATAVKEGKKILFVPDRCLGQNIAKEMGLKATVIGRDENLADGDIICYDGFCSVHQLFEPKDVEFFRKKYPGILIAAHPECDPSVVDIVDFVGSTSQIIKWVNALPLEQKVAIGTEFNLVNRLREKNTYVLASTKPECPTMNETTVEELYLALKSIEDNNLINEILLDEDVRINALKALDKMMQLSV